MMDFNKIRHYYIACGNAGYNHFVLNNGESILPIKSYRHTS